MESPAQRYAELLGSLVPIGDIPPDRRQEILRSAQVRHHAAGAMVFRQGHTDNRVFYLVNGDLVLLKDGRMVRRVVSGTDAARYPLAHLQPRQYSGQADSTVTVLVIDRELLEGTGARVPPEEGSVAMIDVGDIGSAESSDWMTRLLQSDLFSRVPVANIQRVFAALEPVHYAAGDTVVREGEQGDYFFTIVRGRCQVTRVGPEGSDRPIAELGQGDSFGEEALIGSTPRNATVRMLTDGDLTRLGKEDFAELICKPVLSGLPYDEAKRLVAGGAVWVDVRSPGEHAPAHLPGSLNVPLDALRERAAQLDRGRTHLVYCDDGIRSAVGAFLLTQRGFDARYLLGGLRDARPDLTATEPPSAPSPAVAPPEPAAVDDPAPTAPLAGPPASQPPVTDDRARLRALAVFLKRRLDEESAERARREQEVEGLRAELRHAEAALQAARAASAAPAAQPLVPPQGQRLAETSLAAFRRDAETRLAEACEATRVQAGLTETARRMVEELSQELEENRRQSAEFEARTALAEGEAERLRQTVEQLRAVRARDRREAEAQHAATLAQSQAGLRKALEELEASEHRRRAEVAAQRDELADVLRRAEAAEAALRELRERADLLETQDLGRRQASDQRALASEGRAAELAAELSRLSAAIEASSRELTDAQEARRADVARLEARAAALAAEHTAALARARAEQDRLHSALTAREADLAQATAALADTRGALSALESRAAEMQNRLGEVEAALRNERLRHQDARHELDQSREAQRADVERLETELATLSSEHAAARTRWQDERGELEAARSAAEQQVAARLAAVSAQLTGAEGSLQGAQDRAAAAELRIAELETRIGELETLLGDAEARASSASEARARAEEQRQRAAREAEEAADHAEGLEQRVAHLLGQVAELERPAVPLAPGRTGLALAGLGTAEAEPAELVLATERRRLEAALAHAQSEADAMLQRITADAAGGTRVETAALLEAVARLRGDVAEAQSRRAVLEGRLVQRLMQAYGRSSEESTEEDGPESIDPGGPRRPRDNAQTEVRTLRADCDALRRHLESEGERARQAELEAAEGRAQAQLSERRHQAEIERLRAALRQAQAATDVSRARGKGLPSQGMVGGPTARIHTLARGQSTIDTPLVPRATREELVRQREALEREQDPDDT